jgi:hypothetical protein
VTFFEYVLDDGPELKFPHGGGLSGGGFGDILGGILGALNGEGIGGNSISGNCFLPGACPSLNVPGIASFLPHLPASGCDPGPCVPMTPATSFYGPGAAVAGGVVLEVICIFAEPCGAIELIDSGIAGTAAAGIAFLTRHQNSRAKPSDQECHRIVEQAKIHAQTIM